MKDASPFINACPVGRSAAGAALAIIKGRLTKAAYDKRQRDRRNPKLQKTGKP
jgi:hypothetical protein